MLYRAHKIRRYFPVHGFIFVNISDIDTTQKRYVWKGVVYSYLFLRGRGCQMANDLDR